MYFKKLTITKKKKAMKGGAKFTRAQHVHRLQSFLKASANSDTTLNKIIFAIKAINEAFQGNMDIGNEDFRTDIKAKLNEIAEFDFSTFGASSREEIKTLKNEQRKTKKENSLVLKKAEDYIVHQQNKIKNYKKENKTFKKENKTLKKEVISLTKKLFEEQKKTQKERTKKIIEKQKTRTKNLACKNEIDFILQEKIEDIPTEDLVYIKLKTHIYCFNKDSFKGMITYSKNQKVKGDCKQAIPGKPLDCKWFYPINLGFNVYINKENYTDALKKKNVTKWILKNKRRVDFTTGLHMMSEKSGMDDVYDLVPDKAKFSCSAWRKNPLIDPKTGFKIKKNGPLYKKYQAKCGTPLK